MLLILLSLTSLSLLAITSPSTCIRHDTTHPEGIVPWSSFLVATGMPLYEDWREWPHRFMPYGPLLCYPIGFIQKSLGTGQYDFSYYLAGRLQGFLYLTGIGAVLALVLRKSGVPAFIAGAGAFAYMGLWAAVSLIGVSFRADAPALFWALLASYVIFSGGSGGKRLFFGGIAFLVSIAYRPALWALPAAVALFFLYQRQFRTAIYWSASIAGGIILYILAAEAATGGTFLLNQVGASSMGFTTFTYKLTWDLLLSREEFPLFTWDILLRLVGAAIAAGVLIWKCDNRLDRGFSFYYIVALAINSLTMFKVGSALNYIMEAYVLSGAIWGIIIMRTWQNRFFLSSVPRRLVYSSAGLLILLPMPYYAYKNFTAAVKTVETLGEPSPYSDLLGLPDTAMLGDLAFTHPSPAAHAMSDPLPYVQLVEKGLIEKAPLANRIKSQTFSHVVLSPGMKYLFTAPDKASWAGELLAEHYRLETAVPEYEIWVPVEPGAQRNSDSTNPAAVE